MMKSILVIVLFILSITVFQSAVFNTMPNAALLFNIPLILIIYINWIMPNPQTLLYTMLLSWAVSYISITPFGFDMIAFVILALIIQYLVLNKFTNQTKSSLVITVIVGLAVYDSVLWLAARQEYITSLAYTKLLIHDGMTVLMQGIIALGIALLTHYFYARKHKRQISLSF